MFSHFLTIHYGLESTREVVFQNYFLVIEAPFADSTETNSEK